MAGAQWGHGCLNGAGQAEWEIRRMASEAQRGPDHNSVIAPPRLLLTLR